MIILLCTVIIAGLFSIVTGIGTSAIHLGQMGTLTDIISTMGTTLPLLTAAIVLIPAVVIIYLLVILITGAKPKWWVFVISLIVWIALIISSLFASVDLITNLHTNEVERILKYSGSTIDSPIDSIEYNRLRNDPNVESID